MIAASENTLQTSWTPIAATLQAHLKADVFDQFFTHLRPESNANNVLEISAPTVGVRKFLLLGTYSQDILSVVKTYMPNIRAIKITCRQWTGVNKTCKLSEPVLDIIPKIPDWQMPEVETHDSVMQRREIKKLFRLGCKYLKLEKSTRNVAFKKPDIIVPLQQILFAINQLEYSVEAIAQAFNSPDRTIKIICNQVESLMNLDEKVNRDVLSLVAYLREPDED